MTQDTTHEDFSDLEQPDDDMDEFWDDQGLPAPATLVLRYVDSKGNGTQRIVDVRLFADTPYGAMLHGHCRYADAERSFKIERIQHCVDLNSGETIEDVYSHLVSLYEKTPECSFNRVIDRHIDTLRATMQIAQGNGFSLNEQAKVIQQICQKVSKDQRISLELARALVEAYSAPERTGLDQTFRLIAGRLDKSLSTTEKESVLKLCTRVAELKGAPSPSARELLEYITKRLTQG